MTIKQNGGIFGRNPTFNNLDVEGTLTIDTDTLYVDATNDRVGVNISSPTEALHVNGNIILNDGSFGAGDSQNLILGDKNAYMQSTHGQPVNFGAYHGFVFGRATASNLTIATEQVRIDADGLKFNGDTAAANAIDDYEEGTWTPVYNNAGSVSYDTQNGYYRKIGSVVLAGFTISASSMSATGGNTIEVGGLPFASNSDADIQFGQRGTFEAIFFTVDGTTSYDLAMAGASSTALQIRKMSNGGGNVSSTYSEMTSQTSCQIRGMITYIV